MQAFDKTKYTPRGRIFFTLFFTTSLQFFVLCWDLLMHSSLRFLPHYFSQVEVSTGYLHHLNSFPFHRCVVASVLGILVLLHYLILALEHVNYSQM